MQSVRNVPKWVGCNASNLATTLGMWDACLTVRHPVDHTDKPYRTDLGDAQSWMFTEGQTNWQGMEFRLRALLGELFTDLFTFNGGFYEP